jgi:hypothetical protein
MSSFNFINFNKKEGPFLLTFFFVSAKMECKIKMGRVFLL